MVILSLLSLSVVVDVMRDGWRGRRRMATPLIGRPGPVEGVRNCGDRATAKTKDISREKIRGCSCRQQRSEMTRCAMCGRLRVGKDFLHVAALVGAAMCSAC